MFSCYLSHNMRGEIDTGKDFPACFLRIRYIRLGFRGRAYIQSTIIQEMKRNQLKPMHMLIIVTNVEEGCTCST